MGWVPALVIWLALAGVGAYFAAEWRRSGRDPKGGTIVPLFGPPENLSPAALHFAYRRGAAEDIAVNAGALGALAELLRRRLIRVETGDGPARIVPAAGDRNGLQDDMVLFLETLLPAGRAVASSLDFRTAAYAQRLMVHRTLGGRLMQLNFAVLLTGAGILVAAALLSVVLLDWILHTGAGGLALGGGFAASVPLVAALVMWRSQIARQRWVAAALVAIPCLAVIVLVVMLLAMLGEPQGPERAAALLGLFLVVPSFCLAWTLLTALTAEGRRLIDQIEGFRMFIAVADAGRHAIDNAPDPTRDRLDALMPYAVALHVEAGWVNALAASLPLQTVKAESAAAARAVKGTK